MADFETGYAATFAQVSDERRIPVHATVISPYLEDRYKLLKNVTVTVGVRATHLPLPHPTTGEVTLFLPSAYVASEAPVISTSGAITSTGYNSTNGAITNGKSGVPDNFFDKHNWYVGQCRFCLGCPRKWKILGARRLWTELHPHLYKSGLFIQLCFESALSFIYQPEHGDLWPSYDNRNNRS